MPVFVVVAVFRFSFLVVVVVLLQLFCCSCMSVVVVCFVFVCPPKRCRFSFFLFSCLVVVVFVVLVCLLYALCLSVLRSAGEADRVRHVVCFHTGPSLKTLSLTQHSRTSSMFVNLVVFSEKKRERNRDSEEKVFKRVLRVCCHHECRCHGAVVPVCSLLPKLCFCFLF